MSTTALTDRWSEADGLRTVLPHVRVCHGSLSIITLRSAQWRPNDSLLALRMAAMQLHADVSHVFSFAQLYAQMQENGSTLTQRRHLPKHLSVTVAPTMTADWERHADAISAGTQPSDQQRRRLLDPIRLEVREAGQGHAGR